jgi:TRAP-type uncharacterized transport system substrate-binding protein
MGAAVTAAAAAVATGRLPRWLRVALVFGLALIACGAGLYAYRYVVRPTNLTVAVGSLDGDAQQLTSAIAAQMASSGAPVRLKVIDKANALEAGRAFAAGEADLAVARPDLGDLSSAETVVVVTHAVVLMVAPPGSAVTSMDDLKSKTVGVVGGEINQKVVEALSKEYDLERVKTHFKNLGVADIAPALKAKQVAALLVVMPISERYLGMLRNLFPRTGKQKPALVPIESAGAIAAVAKYYQSYDLPKGTVQGSPPIPDDDMKTFRVPLYLVANKKLSDDVVSALAKAIMDARRDLIGAHPVLAQISEPNTDKTDVDSDTYLPVHPGAAAYFGGTQQSVFDKYSDQMFYGTMLLGTLTSLFAAAWKFMAKSEAKPDDTPLMRLYALTDRIAAAAGEADLAEVERRIDEILKGELQKQTGAGADPAQIAAFGLAAHRLEHLIVQRRAALGAKIGNGA